MKKLKRRFLQKISRYRVITEDLTTTGSRLETVRDNADKSAGLYIGEEIETGRGASEEARLAHIRALKAKWPYLTELQLSTTIAARGGNASEEKRLAFVRRALQLRH